MIFRLTDELIFPDPHLAEPSGLLAVGGDLRPERIILAYENGIFPWYSPGEPILWYATDPRFVLFPEEIKRSKSMKSLINKKIYEVTVNKDFSSVIEACSKMKRYDQNGTWITDDMIDAYTQLHQQNIAKSIEVWDGDELVGGLYGLELNNCFFGESMFHRKSNTSKIALIYLCSNFDFKIIDCQTHTPHLESMGGRMISLAEFRETIQP